MPRPRCDGRTPPHSPTVNAAMRGRARDRDDPEGDHRLAVEDRERVEREVEGRRAELVGEVVGRVVLAEAVGLLDRDHQVGPRAAVVGGERAPGRARSVLTSPVGGS